MPQYLTTEQQKKQSGAPGVCDNSQKPHRFNEFMHGPRGYGHCVNWRLLTEEEILKMISDKKETENAGMDSTTGTTNQENIPATSTSEQENQTQLGTNQESI